MGETIVGRGNWFYTYGTIAVKIVEILLCYILAVMAFDVAETTKRSAGRHSYIGEVELEQAATCQPQRSGDPDSTGNKPHILPTRYQAN